MASKAPSPRERADATVSANTVLKFREALKKSAVAFDAWLAATFILSQKPTNLDKRSSFGIESLQRLFEFSSAMIYN